MCLQEVQSDHFSEYLHPELTKAGYMGIYKKKTTEIFTGSQYTIDGCATFFRCAAFKALMPCSGCVRGGRGFAATAG
jgi:CCR4-NOT transcription complex subunit 6